MARKGSEAKRWDNTILRVAVKRPIERERVRMIKLSHAWQRNDKGVRRLGAGLVSTTASSAPTGLLPVKTDLSAACLTRLCHCATRLLSRRLSFINLSLSLHTHLLCCLVLLLPHRGSAAHFDVRPNHVQMWASHCQDLQWSVSGLARVSRFLALTNTNSSFKHARKTWKHFSFIFPFHHVGSTSPDCMRLTRVLSLNHSVLTPRRPFLYVVCVRL